MRDRPLDLLLHAGVLTCPRASTIIWSQLCLYPDQRACWAGA